MATASAPSPSPRRVRASLSALVALAAAAAGALAAALWVDARSQTDNVGGVPAAAYLSYGPVDVVYTWVNGSDPRWKAEKDYWHKHWIASLTGQPLPSRSDAEAASKIQGTDSSNADNRFRDNEELRYSLRSVEKYAPWVRRVFVVTDGQIPSWLDIDSPRVTVVPHREIFANRSHLPVFSSPAIEWSLDNIPGLSDWFLYLNDDVFFGAPVFPEDFVSQQGVQKAYFAWEAPLCAPSCWHSALQNGRCDRECNVSSCDFDMGDCGCQVDALDGSVACDPDAVASILEQTPRAPQVASHLCHGRCHFAWLGNGHCDRACNMSSCGFDGGDCGVVGQPGASTGQGAVDVLRELPSAAVAANETLVHVPLAVNATYLNLTGVFGADGGVVHATHDNAELIRFATLLEEDMLLLLVFGRDPDSGDAMTSSAALSVTGVDANGSALQLELSVVRGNKRVDSALVVQKSETQADASPPPPRRRSRRRQRREQLEAAALALAMPKETIDPLSGGFSTFANTSIRPSNIRLPFGFRQAVFAAQKAADGASDAPRLDVFLPFNVTGKKLKDGDVLQLGWSARLRVHDDREDDDVDWSVVQTCRLRMPKQKKKPSQKTTTVPSLEDAGSGVEAVRRKQDKPVEVEVPIDSAKNFAADLLKALETQEDSTLAKEVHAALAEEAAARQKLQSTKEEEATAPEPTTPAEPEDEMDKDDGVPKCELMEHVDGETTRRGVRVSIRLPGADALVSSTEETTESGPETPSTATSLATESVSQVVEASVNAADGSLTTARAQVADGSVCFFDADRPEPKRYCFSLALGLFHALEQQVVHLPTLLRGPDADRVVVPYEPYVGENPALVELADRCVDVTLRLVGMKPQVCWETEEPVAVPADEAESKQREQEREGRRLACEAQRRRLAQRQKDEEEDEPSVVHAVKRVVDAAVARVVSLLGFSVVEQVDEDLNVPEYHDVCDPEALEPRPTKPKDKPAALLSKDTFGDSLRFVNKLYSRVFGKGSSRRRVPSHMAFMLKKQYIREIKQQWAAEVNATSAHRFRHPEDMQFSFSYFHYLLNRHELVKPTLEQIWREYLDVNRNGILDENELLTAASLAYGNYPPDSFVDEARACLQPEKREKVREHPTALGTVRLAETLTPYVTLEHLERCPTLVDGLLQHVRRDKLAEVEPEDEVTFHMLSDNFRFAWNQMLGTRARRTKFVCINDDMKFPTPSVSQILHELFLSIWPKRSQFELPFHLKNRFAHIDEVAKARARRHAVLGVAAGLALLLAVAFRRALLSFFGFHDIARARAASASQLQREMDERDADDSATE